MNTQTIPTGQPLWLTAAAGFGTLWNAYGLYQFAGTFSQTSTMLMQGGLTRDQADLYLSLPGWMTLAFGLGVGLGLAGSLTLLLGRRLALPLLLLSLVAYGALFAGDLAHGVFAAIASQLAILSVVLAIAAGLAATALTARRRGLLS